ncbi:hypothetical protein EVAR_49681_1 [Eumeta japonica]|uniref:Uncharacterized protein n=1 Tax=Eumeta variegata TaxID=151549 RepID=A0A4C1WTY0_EUMVA|nr:hypothetical protein EVAR_49681_1 [Eumeta japonica]
MIEIKSLTNQHRERDRNKHRALDSDRHHDRERNQLIYKMEEFILCPSGRSHGRKLVRRTKRECGPSESKWSPPPMDTRNPRAVTCALPAFHVRNGTCLT